MIRRMKRENAMETGFRRCYKGLGIERKIVSQGLSDMVSEPPPYTLRFPKNLTYSILKYAR